MKHLKIKFYRIKNWVGFEIIEQVNFAHSEEWESSKTGITIKSFYMSDISGKTLYIKGADNYVAGKSFNDCETAIEVMGKMMETVKEFNEYFADDIEKVKDEKVVG